MTKKAVLTGVGRDRVGIVAELSQALYKLGCNLLDSSMTLLRGEFAVILMIELPENQSIEKLKAQLQLQEKTLGLNIYIRELSEEELLDRSVDDPGYIISVYGADRPGIVAGVTKILADQGINITDVETKSTGDMKKPLYVMLLEVTAPTTLSLTDIEKALKSTSQKLEVDISVQPLEVLEL